MVIGTAGVRRIVLAQVVETLASASDDSNVCSMVRGERVAPVAPRELLEDEPADALLRSKGFGGHLPELASTWARTGPHGGGGGRSRSQPQIRRSLEAYLSGSSSHSGSSTGLHFRTPGTERSNSDRKVPPTPLVSPQTYALVGRVASATPKGCRENPGGSRTPPRTRPWPRPRSGSHGRRCSYRRRSQ